MKNFFKFILLSIMLFLIRRKKREIRKDTLLLIRLDAIGDYIMFRNFIYELKKDERYKDHKITLCGNIIWKELAETLDSSIINDFIWIERLKFLNNPVYKYEMLKIIYMRGFETAVETIHSREILFGDAIIAASGARQRIGTIVSEKYHRIKKGIFSDHYYTRLISSRGGIVFEFDRTKEFFSRLLEKEISLQKPFIIKENIIRPSVPAEKYILLFPGASRKEKLWPSENFRKVAEYLIEHYSYKIVTAGSESEHNICEQVRPQNADNIFYNLCGGTLSGLAGIISGAELLISNDTSAIHFAAALNKPFICVANGFYYGRFYPYPENIYEKGYFLYPSNFKPGKIGDLNSVSPQEVISLMNNLLN